MIAAGTTGLIAATAAGQARAAARGRLDAADGTPEQVHLTWDGDPTQATVDITAIYTANTAPIDLVEHQLAGRSQYEINQYKQRLPFNVLLNMKG